MTVLCPTATTTADGDPHTIQGCGSSNVVHDSSDPGIWDCLDCGIYFQPDLEPAEGPAAVQPPLGSDGGRS